MQRLLNPNEAARIDERLHDNVLLQVCRKIWPERQEEITSVMVRAEDVFFEVAWLIDELIDVEINTDIKTMIRGLWSTVNSDIGNWASNIPRPERYLAASTVFRIAATAFSLHWQSHYCDTMRDALLMIIDEKRTTPQDLYGLQEQKRQQEELMEAIIQCSKMLSEWVNDYIDNPDLCLTEEIELALNPSVAIEAGKQESRKEDRKVFDANTFRETFTYQPDGMSDKERVIRLKMAFNRMRGTLIDRETHYDTFESLFSGKPLDVKVVWIGINSQLRRLFNQLVTKRHLLSKPTGGLNQILTARFKKPDGTSFTAQEIKDAGNDGDMSVVNEVVEILTPAPVSMEDLEQQLSRLKLEEQERAELRGKINGKPQKHLPKGTNVSQTPNQHTRVRKKKI